MDTLQAHHAVRAVPRYTSYPTAPHFKPAFPEALVRRWLAALPPADPVSLYLHVPFCRQMCWYCGCNMKLAARDQPLRDYTDRLLQEIDLVADAAPTRLAVRHLHFGGGTPTALDPSDLRRLMDRLRQRFDLLADAELAIESDPRTLTAAMAETIGDLGFTRASFGVQEFDPRVQAAINRIQPPGLVADAVAALRGAGVREINFDLIYGLPYQTVDTLVRSVRLAAAMGPGRIALFGYAHVPWIAKNQRMIPQESLPDSRARLAQANAAGAELEALGYLAIGLDHYALPDDPMTAAWQAGKLRRNFQGYTTDTADTLLAFGASSIGRTPAGWWQSIGETGAWARAVADGRLPVAKGIALSADDRLRAFAIERLMCDGALDLAAVARRFGVADDWAAEPLERLRGLEADGLVSTAGGRVVVAATARSALRLAAAAFDAYLPGDSARYSVAV